MSNINKYWKLNLSEGDLIYVGRGQETIAKLKVRTVVGNRVIYDVIDGNRYYGTKADDKTIHKQDIVESDFRIERNKDR
jgi:hypothetical protein